MTWLTPAEAADLARRNVVTVRRALESGELHGHQRTFRGRWQISPAAVDAWVQGRPGRPACGCRPVQIAKKTA